MRVERKCPTVKDLIVLTAHHVEVDHRQAGLDRAGHHVVVAGFHLAAIIGRTVGDQQELGTGFF